MSIFVLIFGPSAVGKMTVGQELSRASGIPLFHNHRTIDAIVPVFEFGSAPYKQLVAEIRTRVFEEAVTGRLPGLIFTYVWPLDSPESRSLIQQWCEIFRKGGWSIVFVELRASLKVRLQRNSSPNRLLNKSMKRDIQKSEYLLRKNDVEWRANSNALDRFDEADVHMILDTERTEPKEAASEINACLATVSARR